MQKGCVTVQSYRLGGRARQGPSQWQGHESFGKFWFKISVRKREVLCKEPTAPFSFPLYLYNPNVNPNIL